MLETLICIILFPFALGTVLLTGAVIAGTVKYFKSRKLRKVEN